MGPVCLVREALLELFRVVRCILCRRRFDTTTSVCSRTYVPHEEDLDTDRIMCLSSQQPQGQHTGQNSLKVEVPGSNVSTSTLNLSFSDSRPVKLTLISFAGSGFYMAVIR